MLSTNQPSPAKMHKQAEEIRWVQEAWEREEQEKEEALLRAAEEEEKWEAERKQWEEEEKWWRAEAALAAEKEYGEQGWQIDNSLEEFQRCQLVFKSPVKSGYWVPNMVTKTITG